VKRVFRGRSAQASLEFLVTLASVMLVFIIASYFIYFKVVQTLDYKVYVQGTHLANDLAESINVVNRVGDGYSVDVGVEERLYGNREYTISFFRDEPTVFLHGSSFSRGESLWFSAPLSTSDVVCLVDECLSGCNQSLGEVCLNVTGETSIRLVNRMGVVYIAPRYNVRQGDESWIAVPFFGSFGENYSIANDTVEGLLLSSGSVMYLFEDSESRELGLVFKHYGEGVRFDLNVSVPAVVGFSDEVGELVLDREVEGEWDRDSGFDPDVGGFWDGGFLVLGDVGFRVCVDPKDSISGDWFWVNPDGVFRFSDNDGVVCITYP